VQYSCIVALALKKVCWRRLAEHWVQHLLGYSHTLRV
ncbi:AAEL000232-PA, partial [Aedes aegypti]